MSEHINFGFIKDGFNPKLSEFNKTFLEDISKGYGKFVQLLVNGENYIRSGDIPHATLLKFSLDEFGLECGFKPHVSGHRIPLVKMDGVYELVGAGRINNYSEGLEFYGVSLDYFEDVQGTDLGNLENIFGKENVINMNPKKRPPSYLVKI